MHIEYISWLISGTIEITGITAAVTAIFMQAFLFANGIYPVFKVFHEDFFPKFIFKFRDYTGKTNNKLRFVYYLFLLSVIIFIPSFLLEFYLHIKEAPIPILINCRWINSYVYSTDNWVYFH